MDPGLRILDLDNSNIVPETGLDFYLLAFVPMGVFYALKEKVYCLSMFV